MKGAPDLVLLLGGPKPARWLTIGAAGVGAHGRRALSCTRPSLRVLAAQQDLCRNPRLRFRSNTDLVHCQLVYSRLELPPRHPSTRTSVTMGRSNGPRTTTHALGPQALRIEGCEFGSIT